VGKEESRQWKLEVEEYRGADCVPEEPGGSSVAGEG
jgi:hypothetical protein